MENVRQQEREEGTLEGENCQDDLQQKSYLGGQTNNMTRNIGEDWKEIGNNRKENKQEDKELWKQ